MSEPEKESKIPNIRDLLHPRRRDEKVGVLHKLLSSDKDNETKTRIPNVFGMSVLDLLGAWSSPTDHVSFKFEDKEFSLPKTTEGLAQYFGLRYRINAISAGGKSREEYVTASVSYFLQGLTDMEASKQARVGEGAKKT